MKLISSGFGFDFGFGFGSSYFFERKFCGLFSGFKVFGVC